MRKAIYKLTLSFLLTIFCLLLLDAFWLGLMARYLYTPNIGHLMSETPNWWAAIVFYILYTIGLQIFVIFPSWKANHKPRSTAINGALFGLIAYGTYDLTNKATLKNWPLFITVIDMSWGMLITGITVFISIHLTRICLSRIKQ